MNKKIEISASLACQHGTMHKSAFSGGVRVPLKTRKARSRWMTRYELDDRELLLAFFHERLTKN